MTKQSIDMNGVVGTRDVVLVVLDALRFDVADAEMDEGRTPEFAKLFPGGWERRHSPGTFTYPAHQAFFAGFLPTPDSPDGDHERLFASRFEGSETAGERTCVFDAPDIVTGFSEAGYRTICIGGVGFFNKQTPLSQVLPGLFGESHWSTELGVTAEDSARDQFALAAERLRCVPDGQRAFLFINASAIHQPNCHYLEGKEEDDLESHAAALRYVDSQLPALLEAIRSRGGAFLIVCSDHGTLYGEDGFRGHRVAHPDVTTVPYADVLLEN